MACGFARFGAVSSLVLFSLAQASAAELNTYRGISLGSSVAAVRALTTAAERDLFVLSDRPAVLQLLEWRLPNPSAATGSQADPVREMTFNFVDGQLFRISVSYDESRTAGLTKADMIAALESTYGARAASVRQVRGGYDTTDSAPVVAQWRSGDTVVSLQHISYLDGYRLLITSDSLEQRARNARAAARALELRERPGRAAAAVKQQAADDRAAADKARDANKAAFRP